jgi:hypothetical protein
MVPMIGRIIMLGTTVCALWLGAHALLQDSEAQRGGVEVPGGSNNRPTQGDSGKEPGDRENYIANVQVLRVSAGTVYRVRPTRAGRLATPQALRTQAWRQAVRQGVPDRNGLQHQFLCHPYSIIARTKPTWDLESWRPTVGLTRTMLAACNPT